MMPSVVFFVVILLAGGVMAWNQQHMNKQVAALPPDARKRMRTVFPAAMALVLVLVLIVIYFLRPHT